MEKNKNIIKDFHAVEFMREVRFELTDLYHQDKQKYAEFLKKSMEDFKFRQTKKLKAN
jgi:hypothetical protein